ncbi:hypothetical protein B0H13DRAFT_1125917 [Mycena leptocephala]|nr:hypothetical protein B0H13DRAFT_1125917 [Mycena leptocephala]
MSGTPRAHVASPVVNSEVRCFKHGGIALPRRISRTQKNPNRAFYSCEVADGSDGAKCNFFKWEDELSMASPSPSQGDSPSTPRKRPASTAEHELSPMQKWLKPPKGPRHLHPAPPHHRRVWTPCYALKGCLLSRRRALTPCYPPPCPTVVPRPLQRPRTTPLSPARRPRPSFPAGALYPLQRHSAQ